jgi:hypothetical protein
VQNSGGSHAPVEARHSCVDAANPFTGQSGEDPLQYSGTSHTAPAVIERHRVPALPAGWVHCVLSQTSMVQTLSSSVQGVPAEHAGVLDDVVCRTGDAVRAGDDHGIDGDGEGVECS